MSAKEVKLIDPDCDACAGTGLNLGGGSRIGSIEIKLLNCACVEFVTMAPIIKDVIDFPLDLVDDDTPKGTEVAQEVVDQADVFCAPTITECDGSGVIMKDINGNDVECLGCKYCRKTPGDRVLL